MTSSLPHEADPAARYLRHLRRALAPLPAADRAEIVAEIASHLAERTGAGAGVADVLAALGDPEELGRAYAEHRELAHALGRASPWPLVAAVLDRAGRSTIALMAGLAAVILYAAALSLALVGVMKPVAPGNVGFWTGPDGSAFGFLSAPPRQAAERLDLGIMPLALVGAVLCYLAATSIVRRCGRRLLARAPA